MTSNARRFSPVVLRYGLVLLFLWFGLSQVTDPAGWVSWVPEWASGLFGGAATVVLLNGAFEVIFGVALAVGFYTRVSAFLLALHLFVLAFEIGYNDIGVRDFALAIATLAVALHGPDFLTVDARRAQRNIPTIEKIMERE